MSKNKTVREKLENELDLSELKLYKEFITNKGMKSEFEDFKLACED